MRVCIVSDQLSGYRSKGGAEVQLEKTIEVFKNSNIEVVFYDSNPLTILESDFVHFFKSLTWYWPIASFCLKNNKPYFVSSIFYITDKYNFSQFYLSRKLRNIGMLSVSSIVRLWENANCVFPNTSSEEEQILRYANAKTMVVRNCVDDSFINEKVDITLLPESIKELKGDFVLNIGRLEPRKNQIRLAEACNKIGIPLVLIGPYSDNKYYRDLMKYKGVIYLGEIWNTSLKKSIINECSLFALPSVLETPGIVALEAKLLRKKILITKNGIGKGYFEDYSNIRMVNPFSSKEIYTKIKKMLSIKETRLSVQLDIPTYDFEIKRIVDLYNKNLN
jgi:glycosyltransferase involved in cell wall biosynthesis